jgi:hypothetical protein
LPGQPDFRQDEVAGIPANFVIVQLHKTSAGKGKSGWG